MKYFNFTITFIASLGYTYLFWELQKFSILSLILLITTLSLFWIQRIIKFKPQLLIKLYLFYILSGLSIFKNKNHLLIFIFISLIFLILAFLPKHIDDKYIISISFIVLLTLILYSIHILVSILFFIISLILTWKYPDIYNDKINITEQIYSFLSILVFILVFILVYIHIDIPTLYINVILLLPFVLLACLHFDIEYFFYFIIVIATYFLNAKNDIAFILILIGGIHSIFKSSFSDEFIEYTLNRKLSSDDKTKLTIIKNNITIRIWITALFTSFNKFHFFDLGIKNFQNFIKSILHSQGFSTSTILGLINVLLIALIFFLISIISNIIPIFQKSIIRNAFK